jgi:HK97 family phage prohead protease
MASDVRVRREREPVSDFIRAIVLDDIRIRSGGSGRTVEAYAAVFDEDAEVMDEDGHYIERNARGSFTQTISHRRGRFPVVYNHGLTLVGTPSDRGSVPIGVSTEVRADKRGVLTVSEYGNSPLADEVLDAIRAGSLTGQSYGGRFIKSDPGRTPRGGWRREMDGSLRTVTRLEIAMREFGPTPFPAFVGAAIAGVRAQQMLGALLAGQQPQMNGLTTPSEAAADDSDTPDSPDGVGPTDEALLHSARSIPLATRIRAARITRGWE